jgi:hypothetical protein
MEWLCNSAQTVLMHIKSPRLANKLFKLSSCEEDESKRLEMLETLSQWLMLAYDLHIAESYTFVDLQAR